MLEAEKVYYLNEAFNRTIIELKPQNRNNKLVRFGFLLIGLS